MTADVLAEIGRTGVVAILRADSTDGARDACLALRDGDVTAIEVTMTTPGALDLIASLADEPGLMVGAGTVLDGDTCQAVVDAGARFVVSPGFDADVLAACRRLGVVSMVGCLTPTEVMQALRAGADIVKLFPGRVASPEYVADLLGPLPGTRFVPTGGLTLERAAAYIRAGVYAVGVGGQLLNPAALHDVHRISAQAKAFRHSVDSARERS
jgi:2-dehydro-3-deoxyphosphogluconate aldolase / (4S)-4-hydroxy-2-oxoglutarate aldolase